MQQNFTPHFLQVFFIFLGVLGGSDSQQRSYEFFLGEAKIDISKKYFNPKKNLKYLYC